MSKIRLDLRTYFYIFIVGVVIEYFLLKYGVVPEEVITMLAPAWSNTFVWLSIARLIVWIWERE